MNVVSYLKGIPNQKNMEKIQVLKHFIEGVNATGDHGEVTEQHTWKLSDVAVIQGFVHETSPRSPHLMLRKKVFDNQTLHGKNTIIIDSNLFLYANPGNTKHYLRYSANGVFPTTGNYFDKHVDITRWNKISKNLNIKLKDTRLKGDHILICCQRNGGWSMGGLDVVDWLSKTVKRIRKLSDRPIVIRKHPGDRRASQYLNKFQTKDKNVKFSNHQHILQDFANCWAVITYNSSPGVAAAIEGIPVFVTDSNPQISQAFDVANTSLLDIENPILPDRQRWIERISMSHWNFTELQSGEAWAHMRSCLNFE